METVKRMWINGPLRQFSDKQKTTSWTPYRSAENKGFAGSYVCDRCAGVAIGLYRVISGDKPAGIPLWVCSSCRDAIRPKHAQPEHLKRR